MVRMIDRIYENILREHFRAYRQMAFIAGPRQVGKTTTAKRTSSDSIYINWDNQSDRFKIIGGADQIADNYGLKNTAQYGSSIIFDEIHKYSKWKNFLKGFYDIYGNDYPISVTGSARLSHYKKGGDSLMGRYFLYRLHPMSVAEIIDPSIPESEIRPPKKISADLFEQLYRFGGFPEPFIKADSRFYNRWKRLRLDTLFHEDIRDLTNIQEISQIEMLAELIKNRCGQLINYSSLAKDINVSVDTIRRWIVVLSNMYYSFVIRPWYTNIPKSLRKQPKVYLWDWSLVSEAGAKFENFIASHLLKAVHFWTDSGLGEYDLFFVRDKNKREVDFLVTRQNIPWILVEAKTSSANQISPSLSYFARLLQPEFAFQVSRNSPYTDTDSFAVKKPVIIPALTFLSQLI